MVARSMVVVGVRVVVGVNGTAEADDPINLGESGSELVAVALRHTPGDHDSGSRLALVRPGST